ncbi:MAG: hypothetical protein AAB368_15850, partial [bacterium]
PGRRTYMLGDAKTYYFPGAWRVNALYNPPLLARCIRDSADADEVAKRLRQRGIVRVLYNIGGSMRIESAHRVFRWRPRELALLEAFFGRWLKPAGNLLTAEGDPMYLLYNLARGRHPLPEYLPGVDVSLAEIEEAVGKGERKPATERARALLKAFPESAWLRARIRRLKVQSGSG